MPTKLILISPSTLHLGGHSYNQMTGFQIEANRLGLDLRLYINKLASPRVCETLAAKPVFSSTCYGTTHFYSSVVSNRVLKRIDDLTQEFSNDCVNGIEDSIDATDMVYIDNPSEYIINGLCIWFREFQIDAKPKVFIYFENNAMLIPGTNRPNEFAQVYRKSLKQLESIIGVDNLFITSAVGQFMSDPREDILDTKIHGFPFPKYYFNESPDSFENSPVNNPLNISFLGQVDERKNSRLVPEIIKTLNNSNRGINFYVQCYPFGDYAQDLSAWLEKELKQLPYVSTSNQALSTEEYFSVIEKTDIIVLPYNASIYRYVTSGVLAESIASGIPSVVPSKCWSGHALRQSRSGGVTFSNDSCIDIVNAVQQCIDNFDILSEQARSASKRWRERQSINAYLRKLIEMSTDNPQRDL